MTEKARQGYRERLNVGDIVYFVEGEDTSGSPASKPVVKKATVDHTHYNGHRRRYPGVSIWSDPSTEPKYGGVVVGKSPRQLFTADEVQRVIDRDIGPVAIDGRSIDTLIRDDAANQELTAALGATTISRLADDEARRPKDPEF